MPEYHPLRGFGWAPGGYTITCIDCPVGTPLGQNIGAKRSWRCETHAQEAKDHHAKNPPPPPPRPTMDFNINYSVLVKLNQRGLDELKRQYDDLRSKVTSLPEWEPPKTDEDGYTKFQLWSLMKELGHLCGLGLEPPFDTKIKIILDQK